MSSKNSNGARHKTRNPGVTYRFKKDGSRSYAVGWQDESGWHWKSVDGGEKEAVVARGDILRKLRRGETVSPTKASFGEVAEEWWAVAEAGLGERAQEQYRRELDLHVLPALGKRKLAKLSKWDMQTFIAMLNSKGLAPWSVRGIVARVGSVYAFAVDKGYVAENPVRKLQPGDRPKIARTEKRILEPEEIEKLLANAGRYRSLLAGAIFSGLRQSELLGLVWGDLDFNAGLIRVRQQLSRKTRTRKSLKTEAAQRDVVLSPYLAQLLREHKAASRFSGDEDFVYCSFEGRPLHWSNVDKRGLHAAVAKAKLREPRPRFHDCRHTFASALIAAGVDVGFLSTQLGHASPDITLKIYTHEFQRAKHSDDLRAKMDAAFGVGSNGQEKVGTDGHGRVGEASDTPAEPARLRVVGTSG